jgi:hypothetical protein
VKCIYQPDDLATLATPLWPKRKRIDSGEAVQPPRRSLWKSNSRSSSLRGGLKQLNDIFYLPSNYYCSSPPSVLSKSLSIDASLSHERIPTGLSVCGRGGGVCCTGAVRRGRCGRGAEENDAPVYFFLQLGQQRSSVWMSSSD